MTTATVGRFVARAALVVAVLAALAVVAAGPGTRLGLWPFRTGFVVMRWSAYAAIVGAALGLIGLVLPGARIAGAAALLAGAATFGVPWMWMRTARSVPPIHDISTDTENPPAFAAVLPKRAGAPNPPEYAGAQVAAQQKAAYPDLRPLRLELPPAEAFGRALQVARDMGWEIVAAQPEDGRIEATDTTRWFGFKDDIVVRVRPEEGGSRVDVRSKSRVGRSDVGTNAGRIRRFLDRLRSTR